MTSATQNQIPNIAPESLLKRVKQEVLHRVYLYGYGKTAVPRFVRKVFCRTELHRAWLSGFNGVFSQDGIKYGPANPYSWERHEQLMSERSALLGDVHFSHEIPN